MQVRGILPLAGVGEELLVPLAEKARFLGAVGVILDASSCELSTEGEFFSRHAENPGETAKGRNSQ